MRATIQVAEERTSCAFFQSQIRYTPGLAPVNQSLWAIGSRASLHGSPGQLFRNSWPACILSWPGARA
jgi:hypothetical protein